MAGYDPGRSGRRARPILTFLLAAVAAGAALAAALVYMDHVRDDRAPAADAPQVEAPADSGAADEGAAEPAGD